MISMAFAPVDSTIKEKIISAYLAGRGRNQIDRDLNGQGIRVSHSSISNIINAYRRQHEQSSKSQGLQSHSDTTDSNASISTTANINDTDSPLLNGIGQANIN